MNGDHFGIVRRADGMRSAECNGNAQPAGMRRHDGTLWFPTIKGVVPSVRRTSWSNRLPPPVVIERFTVDGTAVATGGDVPRRTGRRRARVPLHGVELRGARRACDSSIGSWASTATGWTPAGAAKPTTPTFRPGRTSSR